MVSCSADAGAAGLIDRQEVLAAESAEAEIFPHYSIGPEATIGKAVALMIEQSTGLLTVAAEGKLLGVVTLHDVLRYQNRPRIRGRGRKVTARNGVRATHLGLRCARLRRGRPCRRFLSARSAARPSGATQRASFPGERDPLCFRIALRAVSKRRQVARTPKRSVRDRRLLKLDLAKAVRSARLFAKRMAGVTRDSIRGEITPPSRTALRDKVLLITGASRGIGLAIARSAAREGARIAVVAKTQEPHPRLPGTIFSAAKEIEAAGGTALPIACDIRSEEQIEAAVAQTVHAFGGIDILINNASAIQLSATEALPAKRFDLMHEVNARGTFLCVKHCVTHLRRSANPHVLTMAPPISLRDKWFARHVGYTVSKFAMAMITFGFAAEFRHEGIAFNCLWPRTIIQTAALAMIPGIEPSQCRTPEIVADAARAILSRPAAEFSGNFCVDEEILREEGQTDLSRYRVQAGGELQTDLFLE